MRFESYNPTFIDWQERIYPVGSIYASVSPTNPADIMGFGTWVAFGAGRVPVGVDSGDSDFDAAEKTGGAKEVTLAEAELPAHSHAVDDPGHAHGLQRYPTTTGPQSGFTADTSMNGTPTAVTLPTEAATTGVTIQNTGDGQAHQNMPPYIAVHLFKRTA